MKLAVLRLWVEIVIFPAFFVFTSHILGWFHILSEKELLHRTHILACCRSQILEWNFVVLVIIKPVKKLSYQTLSRIETPCSYDIKEFIILDVTRLGFIHIHECFLAVFVLIVQFTDESFPQIWIGYDFSDLLLASSILKLCFLNIFVVLRIFVGIVPKVERFWRLNVCPKPLTKFSVVYFGLNSWVLHLS